MAMVIKQREINIELLRIISMLLVLVIHYNVGINGDVTQEMVKTDPMKACEVAFLKSLSFVCVNCFIIISGYFGIQWRWSGLFKYLFQISFWGGMVHLIAVALGITDFSLLRMLDNMFLFLFDGNWFFVAYLGLYMFAPILNAYLEKSETRQLGWMLVVFYLFQTVFGWIAKNCIEFSQGLTFVSFIGLYLLGAYLKRTQLPCFHWGTISNFCIYLAIGVFCVIISLVSRYYGASKDIYSYISPLQIAQTIYLFLACKALVISPKYSNVILFFSTSAFAGLLLHSWEGVSIYSSGLVWINENIPYKLLVTIIYILCFFFLACCLDKIRLIVWLYLKKH